MPSGHPCAGCLWVIQHTLKEGPGELSGSPPSPILLQGPEQQWCEEGRSLQLGPHGVVTDC